MMRIFLTILVVIGLGGALAWSLLSAGQHQAAIAQAALKRDTDAGLEEWQKNGNFVIAQGTIDIEEGTTRLSTSIPARVDKVMVKDGDSVKAGQVLVELDSRQARISLDKARAGVQEAEVRLREATNNIAQHALGIRQQQQKLAAARAALEMEETQLQRIVSVGDTTATGNSNRETQQQRVIAQRAVVEVETLQLEFLEKINPQDRVDQANAALSVARSELDHAQAHLDNFSVKAPSDGTVLQVSTRSGEVVGPASELVWFVGNGPRVIRCEVNHRFSRKIDDGMRVLYYEDDTGDLLGTGRVERRSTWIGDQRDASSRPFQRVDQRTLECLVAIDSHPDRLWIGERVRVVIRTDEPNAATAEDVRSPVRSQQALR